MNYYPNPHPVGRRKHPQWKRDKAKELFATGLDLGTISREIAVPHATLRSWKARARKSKWQTSWDKFTAFEKKELREAGKSPLYSPLREKFPKLSKSLLLSIVRISKLQENELRILLETLKSYLECYHSEKTTEPQDKATPLNSYTDNASSPIPSNNDKLLIPVYFRDGYISLNKNPPLPPKEESYTGKLHRQAWKNIRY